jgi:hypothetical protein
MVMDMSTERLESLRSLARKAGVHESKAAETMQRLRIKPSRRVDAVDVFSPEDAEKLAAALKDMNK